MLTHYVEHEELSDKQRNFNYVLSTTRMDVECAFGMLKNRFRLLRRPLEQKSVDTARRVVLACMALHHVLINLSDSNVDNGTPEEDDTADTQEGGVVTTTNRRVFGAAKRTRKIFLDRKLTIFPIAP